MAGKSIVHTGPAKGGKTVLIAVDEKMHSRAAFNWYFENLHRKEDFIVIAHIPEAPPLPNVSLKQDGLHVPFEEWKRVMEESINRVNKMQADYETDMVQRKLRYKITGEHSRHIYEGILHEADKCNADYIVVGTRGLGALKRAMLGSVSDNIIHHSTRPVIVVPYKEK